MKATRPRLFAYIILPTSRSNPYLLRSPVTLSVTAILLLSFICFAIRDIAMMKISALKVPGAVIRLFVANMVLTDPTMDNPRKIYEEISPFFASASTNMIHKRLSTTCRQPFKLLIGSCIFPRFIMEPLNFIERMAFAANMSTQSIAQTVCTVFLCLKFEYFFMF